MDETASAAERGTLVAVVGPSGVGKDTLIARSRDALAGDPRFVFVRRVITRPLSAGAEVHDPLDEAAFTAAERAGAFALVWRAHGLGYGLPRSLVDDLDDGRVVVANLSRAALPAVAALSPRHLVVSVTAAPEVLAARLAARGRETPEDIARRLARAATEPVPAGAVEIRNDGSIATAVEAFVSLLRRQVA